MSNDILTPEKVAELIPSFTGISTTKDQLPATPTQDALAAFAKEHNETLVCANLLTPEERATAWAEAQELAPKIVDSIDVLFISGTSAVDELNNLVKKATAEDKSDASDAEPLMRELQDYLRGVGNKYDVSQPEVRAKFEAGRQRFLGFLWQTRTMLQMLIEESQTVAEQVEGVGEHVGEKAESAMDDARLFKQLYDANERAIRNLVKAIAVLEYARAIILKEYESIKVDPQDASQHVLIERQGLLARVLGAMNIRIGDFQTRLTDAYSASPEFSDWVWADFDLALRLDFLHRMVIPAILTTLLTWQKNASAVGTAKVVVGINQFYNDVKQQSARAGASGIKEVEAAAQQPIMVAETLQAILKAAEDRAQSILDATKAGAEARQKFAEGALGTIRGLQATQVQLHQDLATQASSEAAALQATTDAQHAVGLLNMPSTPA